MDMNRMMEDTAQWWHREWSHTASSARAVWQSLTPPTTGTAVEWLQWGVLSMAVVVGVIVVCTALRMAFVIDDSRGSRI